MKIKVINLKELLDIENTQDNLNAYRDNIDEKKNTITQFQITEDDKFRVSNGKEFIDKKDLDNLAEKLANTDPQLRKKLKGDENERSKWLETSTKNTTEKKALESELEKTIELKNSMPEKLKINHTKGNNLISDLNNTSAQTDKNVIYSAIDKNTEERGELEETEKQLEKSIKRLKRDLNTNVGTKVELEKAVSELIVLGEQESISKKKLKHEEVPRNKIDIVLDNQILNHNDVTQLASFLMNEAFDVKTLSLKNCGLDNTDVETIMDAIGRGHLKEFEIIDFSKNNIDNAGAISIAKGLNKINHVDQINLDNTKIGDKGLAALTYSILSDAQLVNTLNMRENNQITLKGAENFVERLKNKDPYRRGCDFNIDVLTHNEKESKKLLELAEPLKNRQKVLPIKSVSIADQLNSVLGIQANQPISNYEILKKSFLGQPIAEQNKSLSLFEEIDEKIAQIKQKFPLNTESKDGMEHEKRLKAMSLDAIHKSLDWLINLDGNLKLHLEKIPNNKDNPAIPDYIIKPLNDINGILTEVLQTDKENPEAVEAMLQNYHTQYMNEYNKNLKEAKNWLPNVISAIGSAISNAFKSVITSAQKLNPLKINSKEGEDTHLTDVQSPTHKNEEDRLPNSSPPDSNSTTTILQQLTQADPATTNNAINQPTIVTQPLSESDSSGEKPKPPTQQEEKAFWDKILDYTFDFSELEAQLNPDPNINSAQSAQPSSLTQADKDSLDKLLKEQDDLSAQLENWKSKKSPTTGFGFSHIRKEALNETNNPDSIENSKEDHSGFHRP